LNDDLLILVSDNLQKINEDKVMDQARNKIWGKNSINFYRFSSLKINDRAADGDI
jgi:hypothetical protein